MIALEGICQALLGWLLGTSLHFAILSLVVIVGLLVAGRCLPPTWRYAAWLLLLLRLAVPLVPSLPFGFPGERLLAQVGGMAEQDPGPAKRESILSRFESPAPTRRPAARRTPPEHPDENARIDSTDLPQGSDDQVVTTATVTGIGSPSRPGSLRVPPGSPVVDKASVTLVVPLVLLWALVAFLILLRDVARECSFRRRLRHARPVRDRTVLATLEECAALLLPNNRFRPIRVLETSLVGTPAICGLRRPTLLLPPALLDGFTTAELRHVFLHELSHVKRRDVWVSALLTLERALFWFHPLVHLSISRLRASQECARDHEAVHAARESDPTTYARTLVKLVERASHVAPPSLAVGLLERGRQLKRRILMIQSFRPHVEQRRLPAVLLMILLIWVGFTTTSPIESLAGTNLPLVSVDGNDSLRQIGVERHRQPQDWEQEIAAGLDRQVEVELVGVPIDEAIAWLRQSTGLNFILMPEVIDSCGDVEINLTTSAMRARDVLELICRLTDELDYSLAYDAVVLGYRDQLPRSHELRFYQIEPFVSGADGKQLRWRIDQLTELIREFSGHVESWEHQGAFIEYWNGLLVINQTARVHDDVLAFLERLLNRGRTPVDRREDWRQQLDTALDTRLSVSFQDQDLGAVLQYLTTVSGVNILIHDDLNGEPVDLEMSDTTLRNVLGWLATLFERNLTFRNGVIALEENSELRLEMYEIGQLVRFEEGDEQENHVDGMLDLIRTHIDPESWDRDPRCEIGFWSDLMLVQQSDAAHRELVQLLEAMKRALAR